MKEHLIKGIVREMAPVSFLELGATASPILNDEIINFFFNLIIDEGDEGKAALMINTKNDLELQAWAVQFASFGCAPIPYYGHQNGENFRFITLEKVGNMWKMSDTGSEF